MADTRLNENITEGLRAGNLEVRLAGNETDGLLHLPLFDLLAALEANPLQGGVLLDDDDELDPARRVLGPELDVFEDV